MFDVYLLTDGPDGDVAIPGLALTFGEAGVALCKRDGEPVWDGAWGSLEELSLVERSLLPDGSDGVVIVVVEDGGTRRHRFVLGTDDATATETAVRDVAAAHGLRSTPRQRAVSRLVTVFVILAAMGALAALLLSASHVFQF